jgi:hypothetical protein
MMLKKGAREPRSFHARPGAARAADGGLPLGAELRPPAAQGPAGAQLL